MIPRFNLVLRLLASFLLVWGPPCFGQAGTGNWAFQNWKIEDGLPDNNVSEVRQMPDGSLLVATYGGLVRFDGLRMNQTALEPRNNKSSLVRAMLPAKDGSLWLATGQGRIVRHAPNGPSQAYHPPHQPNSYPLYLCEGPGNSLWVSYSEGEVVQIRQGKVHFLGEDQGLPQNSVAKFTVDRAGRFWAVAGEALLSYREAEGDFTHAASLNVSPNWRRSTAICAAADGGLWLAAGLTVFRVPPGEATPAPVQMGIIPEFAEQTSITRLFEDRSGRLWICLYDGNVYHLEGGKLLRAGSALHEITAVTDDLEGNLWLGASEAGLWRVRPRVLEALADAGPLVAEAMCTAAQDAQGNIWLTGTNGYLLKRESGKWRRVGAESGWTAAEARTVVAGRDGTLWVGTKDEGVFYSTPEGGFQSVPFPIPAPWGNIRAMLVDAEGGIWTAVNADLWQYRGGSWRKYSSNLADAYIQTLVQDAAGVVWAGTSEGQLLAVQDRDLEDRTPADFGDAAVRGLLATPDGALWIGRASEGLVRHKDGIFTLVGLEQGLDFNGISHLVLDGQSRLWGGSAQGIFRVPLAELNAAADGRVMPLHVTKVGRDEGLASLQSGRGYWPNTLQDQSGTLWFNMRTGTALVHPDAAADNPVPPPVTIDAVKLDGKPLEMNGGKGFTLPPNHHSLEVEYAAMSFRSPQNVRVRYKMRGLDTEWTENSRERHAIYSRLAAGSYTFTVIAANDSGRWNETGASIAITVRPFFWQTVWFRFASLVAAIVGVAWIARSIINRRWRNRMAEVERQAALDRERTRIARDMHDELGASLTQIAITSQLAQLDPPEASPGHIAEMAAIARRAVTSLDEIVWAVNPRNDTLRSLVDYVGQHAVDFLSAGGLECELSLPDEVPDRAVSAEYRHHLFLAVKETLTNIVKHAGASRVELSVKLAGQGLDLEIADNGRGFEAATSQAGADGLINIKERIRELHGTCQIHSTPGEGTRVILQLPWPQGVSD
jgi:signal transduction histidine kinase/ligand-binding sensor domain-containing protein